MCRQTLGLEGVFTTRFNLCTVMNVVRRPESFRGRVVPPVEERVERFQDEGLVPGFFRLGHGNSPKNENEMSAVQEQFGVLQE